MVSARISLRIELHETTCERRADVETVIEEPAPLAAVVLHASHLNIALRIRSRQAVHAGQSLRQKRKKTLASGPSTGRFVSARNGHHRDGAGFPDSAGAQETARALKNRRCSSRRLHSFRKAHRQ
jgi:hypothetical protein